MSQLVPYGNSNTGEPYGYGQQNSEPEKVAKKSKFSIFKSDSSKSSSKNGKANASAERTSTIKPVPVNTQHTSKKEPTLQEFNAQVKKFQEDSAKIKKLDTEIQGHQNRVTEIDSELGKVNKDIKTTNEKIAIVRGANNDLARIQALRNNRPIK